MIGTIGNISPISKGGIHSITENTVAGIFPFMDTTFRDALEKALQLTGKSLRSVATAADVSYDQFKSLRQGKSQKTNVDDALKLIRAFGVTPEEFYAGHFSNQPHTTAIPGKVGAGAPVHLTDDHAKGGGLYEVITPPQLIGKHAVAVEVEGDSMEPVYSEGDLLFYIRETHEGVPIEAINRKVIAQTADGKVWVKLLKHGSTAGKFNLLSINPTGDNMHDVNLTWASPVLMHLPADLVTRAK
ncbi:LexA family transcriptional regulator [Thioclava litoralis]|uniref:LexA family transcriptional regulator n=1 Tax=Thioclava litoralis TaxID=3076557 RepID=A0ABZ1DXG3_9RHOB|nr:LexA family transcriptional regulator [Thioclava sp. FTW29]